MGVESAEVCEAEGRKSSLEPGKEAHGGCSARGWSAGALLALSALAFASCELCESAFLSVSELSVLCCKMKVGCHSYRFHGSAVRT